MTAPDAWEGFRLSARQRELWQVGAAGWPSAASAAITLRGRLDGDRLRGAVLATVRRHGALRTALRDVPGEDEPLQVVHTEDAALTWASPGGVVRAALHERGADAAELVVETSALNADRTSLHVMVADIARAYTDPLDEVVQYLQFAEWQRGAAGPGRSGPAGGGPRLPYERVTRPARPVSGDWPELHFDVPETTVQALADLAADAGATLEAVRLACWAGLLARLTGLRTVTVAVELDGHGSPELRTAVGPFSRVVPVTLTVRPDTTVLDLLAQVNDRLEGARDDLEVLAAVRLLSDDGRPALSAGFETVSPPPAPLRGDGVEFVPHDIRVAPTPTHVSLVSAAEDPARPRLRYHPDRFSDEAAGVLADQVLAALEHAARSPGRPVTEVDLCTGLALRRYAAANDTARAIGPGRTFVDDFDGQAAATPDRVAVSDGHESMTYRQLAERTDRLARVLRRHGVGVESLVALCHPPTGAALVAILAIAKAGGAWLPLDAGWPARRIQDIVRDARPALVLSQAALAPLFDEPVIRLDREWPAPGPDAPAARVREQNLAYVIYTSGSTGSPKGVAVTHLGLRNYLLWACRAYRLHERTTSLVHSPLSFDLTITSLLGPLLTGGQVRFADPPNVAGLIRGVTAPGLTLLKLTPAHLSLMADLPPTAVDVLVVGGEALTDETIAPWRRLLPEAMRVNEYGPTETVVGCCAHLDRGDTGRPVVPIGTPVANTRIRLLDKAMRRVGIGVVGEIYIGGAGLARGYHGQPGRTADRFVPDPYGPPGGRLYRTGDLARYLPDGALEYIGRDDTQVQVQGVRVELGEIESVLARHPQVTGCAAAVRGAGAAATLHAFVTGDVPDEASLRTHLAERLPPLLVPHTVTVLDALPLTANGKVDRDRLPDPGPPAAAPAPDGPVRRRAVSRQAIGQVWAEALGVDRVDPDTTFFDLGCRSFHLVEVAARLRREFCAQATILTVLEHPTVALLTSALEALEADAGGAVPSSDVDDLVHRQKEALKRRRQRVQESR